MTLSQRDWESPYETPGVFTLRTPSGNWRTVRDRNIWNIPRKQREKYVLCDLCEAAVRRSHKKHVTAHTMRAHQASYLCKTRIFQERYYKTDLTCFPHRDKGAEQKAALLSRVGGEVVQSPHIFFDNGSSFFSPLWSLCVLYWVWAFVESSFYRGTDITQDREFPEMVKNSVEGKLLLIFGDEKKREAARTLAYVYIEKHGINKHTMEMTPYCLQWSNGSPVLGKEMVEL